ncbi:MAG: ABC transporter substrate-binding protein [Planctomycetes bacterium]|nr:ABC transporter substrate-binding protein [Planctomycetota bacterium]
MRSPCRLAGAVLALTSLASCHNETPGDGGRPDGSSTAPRPARIVSLAGHITESLYALGLTEGEVVGAAGPVPDGIGPRPADLGPSADPDLVALLAVRPDLVVMAPHPAVEAFLSGHGIRFEVVTTIDLLDPVHAIRRMGEIVGRVGRARALENEILTRLVAIKDRLEEVDVVPIAVATSRHPALFVAGHPFLDAAIRYAKGENVLGGLVQAYTRLEPEELARFGPRLLVDASDALAGEPAMPEEVARWWAGRAPPSGGFRAVVMDSDALFSPGPRLAEGVETLARALHPEAFR